MGLSRFYRLLILAALAAGAGSLAYTRGGGSVWFLALALAGAWGMSASALMFLMVRVRADRHMESDTVAPGDSLRVELRIRHSSLLPLLWVAVTDRWLRVQDGEEFRVTRLAYPGFSRRFTVRYRLSGLPRGEYRYAGVELASGDLWGMAVKRRKVPLAGSFAVLPEVRPLLVSPAPRSKGLEEPVSRLFLFGAGVPGSTVRPYLQGDPLRHIHWKSSARLGEWMTRAPEPAEEHRFMVFLDAAAGAYGGEAGLTRFETAVEWVAGLLKLASEERLEAGIAASNRAELWVEPSVRPDFAGLHRLLSGLHPDGERSLHGMLTGKGDSSLHAAYTFAVVTPELREELADAICRLRAAGRPVVLCMPEAVGGVRPAAERERRRKLERSGCPVLDIAPAAKRKAVMLHADYAGA